MKRSLLLVLVLTIYTLSNAQSLSWTELPSSKGYTIDYGSDIYDGYVYFAVNSKTNLTCTLFRQKGDDIEKLGDSLDFNAITFPRVNFRVNESGIYILLIIQQKVNNAIVQESSVMKFNNGKWEKQGTISSDPTCECTDLAFDNKIPYVSCYEKSGKYLASVYKFTNNKWTIVGKPNFSTQQPSGGRIVFYNSSPIFYYSYRESKESIIYTYLFNESSWTNKTKGSEFSVPANANFEVVSTNGKLYATKRSNKLNIFKVYEYVKNNWIEIDNQFFASGDIMYAFLFDHKDKVCIIVQKKSDSNVYITQLNQGKWTKYERFSSSEVFTLESKVYNSNGKNYIGLKDKSGKLRIFALTD